MKKLLFIIILLYGCIPAPAQRSVKAVVKNIDIPKWGIGDTIYVIEDGRLLNLRELAEICKERGHIHLEQFYPKTSDTGTVIIDTDEFTYLVKKENFKIAYKCLRCGEIIKEPVYDTIFKIPSDQKFTEWLNKKENK